MYTLTKNTSGFSTLLSLLVIGLLLVLSSQVLGLYMTETRINQSVYNGIATYAWAEWALEYALLKSKNHRDGFWDEINDDEIDSTILSWSTKRLAWLRINYTFKTHDTTFTGTVWPWDHLILPLFSASGTPLVSGWKSHTPKGTGAIHTVRKKLKITFDTPSTTLWWNIILARTTWEGDTIGISGTGNIDIENGIRDQSGTLREYVFEDIKDIDGNLLDTQEYFMHTSTGVLHTLQRSDLTEPYLIVFNPTNSPVQIHIETDTPFALPLKQIKAGSHIWDRYSQSIDFSEDKSRYYDALKFWLFLNNEP